MTKNFLGPHVSPKAKNNWNNNNNSFKNWKSNVLGNPYLPKMQKSYFQGS